MIGRAIIVALALVRADSLEDEMGPEVLALADQVAEKVIYGIDYENLKPQQFARVIRAWVNYYGEQGLITRRQGGLIQSYVTKVALAYTRGEPFVPYAERKGGRE
jgi:hypothetical protein